MPHFSGCWGTGKKNSQGDPAAVGGCHPFDSTQSRLFTKEPALSKVEGWGTSFIVLAKWPVPA